MEEADPAAYVKNLRPAAARIRKPMGGVSLLIRAKGFNIEEPACAGELQDC
jgi:hypothetical protein